MKVLLINPPDELEVMLGVGVEFIQKYEPLGLLYIAAVARESGAEVEVLDAHAEGLDLAALKTRTTLFGPDVVGISTLTCSGALVYQYGRWLAQESPATFVVLGNVHASVFADAYLRNGCCDAVVHGEGEEPFVALLDHVRGRRALADVPAISYREKDGTPRQTSAAAVVADLAVLPLPARDLVDQSRYKLSAISNQTFITGPNDHAKTMVTSRGCPYRCFFCVVHDTRKQRFNDVDKVVDEFEILEKEYDASYVYLMEPLFMGNVQRVLAICQEIRRRRLQIRWGCDTSVNLIRPDVIRAMADANCYDLSLGIESGVQRLLDVINKKITPERSARAVKTVRDHSDIQLEGLFILGLPGETRADSLRTIRFARSLDLDMAQFSILCPYPGSPMFEELRRSGEIDTGLRDDGSVDLDVWRRYSSYIVFTDNEPIWVTPTQTVGELRALQKRALREFYLRPSQIWKHVRRIRPDNFLTIARIALRGFF